MEQKESRRDFGLTLALFTAAAVGGNSPPGHAQLSKGNQILVNRGLQVQGMVTRDDVFHLTTYQNANHTSINWLWNSNPSLMGAAPGFPWSRWVSAETNVPPQGAELPYMSQLVSLQLGDEWNLNEDATRTRAVNWFHAIRASFPASILYMNNYGGQVGDAQLSDFISRASPDIVALQELDAGRMKRGSVNQAEQIAECLEMEFHFHPVYGSGSEARRPLGLTVVGGLLFSQMVTLYLTPVMYTYLAAIEERWSKWRQGRATAKATLAAVQS